MSNKKAIRQMCSQADSPIEGHAIYEFASLDGFTVLQGTPARIGQMAPSAWQKKEATRRSSPPPSRPSKEQLHRSTPRGHCMAVPSSADGPNVSCRLHKKTTRRESHQPAESLIERSVVIASSDGLIVRQCHRVRLGRTPHAAYTKRRPGGLVPPSRHYRGLCLYSDGPALAHLPLLVFQYE